MNYQALDLVNRSLIKVQKDSQIKMDCELADPKIVLQDSDFWKSFFQRIGEGDSLRMIARDYRIPKSTLWDWIQRNQDLMTQYGEAQQSRAMHHAHSVEELIEKVERGEMDPHDARVSIDARKWLAAKFYPKMFSDKYKLDVETRDLNLQHLDALKQMMK